MSGIFQTTARHPFVCNRGPSRVNLRCCRSKYSVRASLAEAAEKNTEARKQLIAQLAEVKDFGIYGVKAAKLAELKAQIEALEAENPLQNPTEHLDSLAGKWKVLFSTIKITGWRRVTLGLRDIVRVEGLTQEVDPKTSIAVNRVNFSVPAFSVKNGELVLEASFVVVSPNRVEIKLEKASLIPDKLQRVFESNFDLLLSVFNPEGHLDITYCDESLRCGRDDKGNIFVLERA